jgi:type II secretory pathway pseudopilin PulG
MFVFAPRSGAIRRGLTLAELVIVMAILIAVGGIILPLLPGIIGRGETSARATNDGEIYKWIQTYEASTSQYPYDWDSLIDITSSKNESYVGGFTGATPPLQVSTLTGASQGLTGQAAALTGGGIVSAQFMANSGTTSLPIGTGNGNFHDTFYPYPSADRSADRFSIAAGATVVTLTAVGQVQLGLADNTTNTVVYGGSTLPGSGVYVVFGLGRRCSLIGSNGANPPVNFFDKFSLDASATGSYARYGVVFQVAGVNPLTNSPIVSGTTPVFDFGRCKLVKVFRFGGTLTTGDDAIRSYWDDLSTVSGS